MEKEFDTARYEDWVRELSKNHYVFCSEYVMSDDFICFKEMSTRLRLDGKNNSTTLEKLWTLKDGKFYNLLKNSELWEEI